MRGVSGELKRAYLTVARLGSWTMDQSGRVEADVIDMDEFYLDQPGTLKLALQMGRKVWVWPDCEVVERGELLVAVAKGSPEVRDAG